MASGLDQELVRTLASGLAALAVSVCAAIYLMMLDRLQIMNYISEISF